MAICGLSFSPSNAHNLGPSSGMWMPPLTASFRMRSLKLLKDPLLHFVVAGAILFAGYELINRGEINPSATDPVHIGEGEIRWLKETFANQWQRPPTEDELRGLVAGFLEEELFAREAKALGLDQNDTIVRRRLAQKLTFLVDDTSRIVEPADEELRRFYDANAEPSGSGAHNLHPTLLQPRKAPACRV